MKHIYSKNIYKQKQNCIMRWNKGNGTQLPSRGEDAGREKGDGTSYIGTGSCTSCSPRVILAMLLVWWWIQITYRDWLFVPLHKGFELFKSKRTERLRNCRQKEVSKQRQTASEKPQMNGRVCARLSCCARCLIMHKVYMNVYMLVC